MNQEKDSIEGNEMNQSSSSSAPDMKEWDLLESDIMASSKGTELKEDETEDKQSPSGLFIHEEVRHSGVEEITADHHESNSSSDIDIIDECVDLEDNHCNLSAPMMDISFCSSDISSSLSVSEVAAPPSVETAEINEEGEPQPVPAEAMPNRMDSFSQYFPDILRVVVNGAVDYYREGMSVKELLLVAMICVGISCFQHTLIKTSLQHDKKMEKMEDHVNKLITENEHLKSKVLAKIEDGKLFGELDEGVKDLKSENYKLHKAMQAVIHQLEEQTNAIKKGINVKGDKDPNKKEITKLKEQINLLRIDNEELQKQLVRIRYGKYPSHAENHDHAEPRPSSSSEPEQDNKDQQQEIQELRKKLDEEVAKLKNWKDSIEDFVKEIEKPQKGDGFLKRKREHRNEYHRKQRHDNGKHKESYDEERQEEKRDERQHKKKNKKFYNWSWKEIKNNFKGTLENFPDVSDMISKYVLFDKKKVEGIMDTICHYYKKAQDKTQKILESYSIDEKTQNVKNDIWTLMGEMKNKWVHMKNDFLETHFGMDKEEEEDIKPEADEPVNQQTKPDTDEEQAPHGDDSDSDEDSGSVSHEDETMNFLNEDSILNDEEWEENIWNMKEVDELLKEAQRRFTQQESNINSWMFERAQHRAELRETIDPEDDEADNNWFLRRNKEASKGETNE